MWNPPRSLETYRYWQNVWIKLDPVFGFQFPQSCEQLREFFLEISRLSNHLSNTSNQTQINTSFLTEEGVQLILETIDDWFGYLVTFILNRGVKGAND